MFYSQCGQDVFLDKVIFKGFKNGIFVDVGAHDGKKFNNTLFFEETHEWTGINVEPIPDVFSDLQLNRPKCINVNCAIGNSNNVLKDFMINTGHTEMLSGLVETYDQRHLTRINEEKLQHSGNSSIVQVKMRTLESLLEENKISHVNLLSIDVEGAEFDVIRSIDFNKVFIDIICFENNYEDQSYPIIDYLEEKGYYIFELHQDIFMIHQKSRFLVRGLNLYKITQ